MSLGTKHKRATQGDISEQGNKTADLFSRMLEEKGHPGNLVGTRRRKKEKEKREEADKS